MTRLVILMVGLSCAAAWGGTPIDERLDAPAAGEVQISNVSGSVEVTGWDRNRIEITGELGDGTERLDVVQEDDRTLIKVVLPEDEDRRVKSTDLIVKIPRGSALTITAVSADLEVENVRGPQRLQTVSGDLATEAWQDCEAKTVSGDVGIKARGDGGMLTITAVSGDLDVGATGGELMATTVSGDLYIEAIGLSRARLQTTNGDIAVDASLVAGSFDAETLNGDVELQLNGDDNLSVDVETFNGSIANCFGYEVVSQSRYGPGRELRFDTGNGERRIRIKTLNGDVDICGD